MFIFLLLTTRGKNGGLAAAIVFAVFALVLYVPAGYYLEMFLYRRRQRKKAGRRDDRRADVHGRAGAGELLHRAREGLRRRAVIVDPGDEADRLLEALDALWGSRPSRRS